jgi:hypothetical protein
MAACHAPNPTTERESENKCRVLSGEVEWSIEKPELLVTRK